MLKRLFHQLVFGITVQIVVLLTRGRAFETFHRENVCPQIELYECREETRYARTMHGRG